MHISFCLNLLGRKSVCASRVWIAVLLVAGQDELSSLGPHRTLLSAHEDACPLREPGSEELLWKMKGSALMMPES